jgi:hypothetical protein
VRRDREDELDLVYVGGEADAATHGAEDGVTDEEAQAVTRYRRRQLLTLASRRAIPAICAVRQYAALGGPISYGIDEAASIARRAFTPDVS